MLWLPSKFAVTLPLLLLSMELLKQMLNMASFYIFLSSENVQVQLTYFSSNEASKPHSISIN